MTKTCMCCNRELPVEQFWKFKGSKDGRESQCIEYWVRYRCRKLKKNGLKPTNNESALELKNKLIADLQDRLMETEQKVKQLQGRIAELEFRMETANLFQVIKPHPHLQSLVKKPSPSGN